MPPRRRFCASTTEVLCLHRGGVVPPPRRSCASTAEVLCLHNGGLVPPPRGLTAAASLQRCYAAATGCSNAPVPSPIRGLLGPAVLVTQPLHHTPLAARSHAAVTAGVPQSRYQSRDYWSLQPLCCSLTAAASLQRCYAAATGCSNAPVPSPIKGLLGPAALVLQSVHHRACSHAAVTAGVPHSRYQSRDYWSLQPLCRSLTAAASLQRCYAAATGCSNAPVLSAIKGLLGPAVLVPQPLHHTPLAARSHAAVTAGVPQSRYQSRDYWSLQPLCCSLTAAASLQRCYAAATGCSNAPVPSPIRGLLGPAVLVTQPLHHTPLAARSHAAVTAGVPQSRYQSRDYWSLQPLCCSLTAAASLQRCYAAATGCSNAPVPSPIKGLLGPAALVLQSVHHRACSHAAVTAGVPHSRYQSRDYWSLQPLCRSLTAAASLQRCYAAATGCSNAPVLSAIKGLLGPAVLVPQPLHHTPLAARSHAAVTAGVPQSRYQSRDYWSLQPLCCSLTAAASLQRCYAAATGCSNAPVPSPIKGLLGPAVLVPQPVHHSPLAACSHAAVTAGVPQSRYQSRGRGGQMRFIVGDGDSGEERDEREQDQARGEEGRESGQAASGREEREKGEDGVKEEEAEGGEQGNAAGDRVEERNSGEGTREGSEREDGKRGREADEQELQAERQQEGKRKGGQEGNGKGESGTGGSSRAVKSRGRCGKG